MDIDIGVRVQLASHLLNPIIAWEGEGTGMILGIQDDGLFVLVEWDDGSEGWVQSNILTVIE